jgi:hypothetical protein
MTYYATSVAERGEGGREEKDGTEWGEDMIFIPLLGTNLRSGAIDFKGSTRGLYTKHHEGQIHCTAIGEKERQVKAVNSCMNLEIT